MTDDSFEPLADACQTLKGAGGGALQWEWDGRFGAALCSFESDVERSVLAVLDEVFDRIWSAKEVSSGPSEVGDLVANFGGLRSGQMMLTVDKGPDLPLMFCAWWPWGSGERISIRVGLVGRPGSPTDDELEAALRGWFGI